jgi:hypothetical protein
VSAPAFRIVDGRAVPFPEAQGRPAALVPQPEPPLDFLAFIGARNPRERRKLARRRTRGRRGAIPIPPPGKMPKYERKREIRLDAHRLADGRGREALLYLPAGETPTAEHCAAVERALSRA